MVMHIFFLPQIYFEIAQYKLEILFIFNWIILIMFYNIQQIFWKNMLQNYHGWSSNMDTPRKQYNVTTFLDPLQPY
jgi:hypothetical protein